MTIENIKQIIPFIRLEKYTYNNNYHNDYTHAPRPTYNFLIMQEGMANVFLDDTVFKIEKNDVIWIPKNAKYSVEWIGEPVSFFVLHFSLSASFDPFLPFRTVIQKLAFNNIELLLQDFLSLKEIGINNYSGLSIFYRIFSFLYPLIEKEKFTHAQQQVIQPALDYINAHYFEKIQVKLLAELCFISPSRFEHLFKNIMGVSPITYKNDVLIQHVQQKLISDKSIPIQAIADLYGFDSTVYFCRLFKQATGLTPSQYRKANILI